jgi:hypothetical protein
MTRITTTMRIAITESLGGAGDRGRTASRLVVARATTQ